MIARRVLLVFAVVLATAAAGAGLAWRSWTQSPAYTIARIAAAVEHHDRYEFEKYVDLDTLLQSAVTDTADGNALAGALGGAVVTSLKPQLVKMVEDGTMPADTRIGDGVHRMRDPGFRPVIDRVERNAYVHVPTTTNGGAAFTLKIHLTQVPAGYWRVDRVANLKELRALEAEEERARRAAIAKANDEKLASLAVVARLKTSLTRGYYGLDKKNRIQLRLENRGPKRVTAFTGKIRFPTQELREGIRGEVGLEPGQAGTFTWDLDVNRFLEPTVRVFELGETADFEVDVDGLTYADGTRTRRGEEEN